MRYFSDEVLVRVFVISDDLSFVVVAVTVVLSWLLP